MRAVSWRSSLFLLLAGVPAEGFPRQRWGEGEVGSLIFFVFCFVSKTVLNSLCREIADMKTEDPKWCGPLIWGGGAEIKMDPEGAGC